MNAPFDTRLTYLGLLLRPFERQRRKELREAILRVLAERTETAKTVALALYGDVDRGAVAYVESELVMMTCAGQIECSVVRDKMRSVDVRHYSLKEGDVDGKQ